VLSLPRAAYVGAGLLAACLLAALAGLRRRQSRLRRRGRRVPAASAAASRTEQVLRQIERPDDVDFLDQALRSLSASLAGGPAGAMPDVQAARLFGDRLELLLAAPHPVAPPPFTAEDGGRRWTASTDADLPVTAGHVGDHLAPFPALASIGWDDGETLLVDLERIGSVALTGDPVRCVDLLRFLAAELSYNRWSDGVRVTLVGAGEEFVEVHPERISYAPAFDDVATRLEALLDQTLATVADLATGGVLAGRVEDIAGDAWMPEVLLLAGPLPPADTARLAGLLGQLAQAGRGAMAVVIASDPATAQLSQWTVTIDTDGTLTVPALDLRMHAQGIPIDQARDLASLLATARRSDDEPLPRAADDAGWAIDIDAAGGLIPAAISLSPRQTAAPPPRNDAAAGAAESTEDNPPADGSDEAETEVAGAPAGQVVELSPSARAAAGRRTRVEQSDPGLDDDLAAWFDPDQAVPRVALIGPVTVTASGRRPDRRIDWYTEVIAYLATRPRGATAEELTLALWHERAEEISPVTRRQALSTARGWLGQNPAGELYLPNMYAEDGTGTDTRRGVYRLAETVLVDWNLLRRLRRRGEARGHDGTEDLRQALRLVRGRPFANTRAGRYAWLVLDDLNLTIAHAVVDVAHDLAIRLLVAGDPAAARWAAEQAQLADDADDRPFCDLMTAAHAEGKTAEVRGLLNRLMRLHEADVEEDLPPATFELVNRLLYLPPAAGGRP
jgi:hypothetical protein